MKYARIFLIALLTLALIFSMGLHAVQVEHEHFSIAPGHNTSHHEHGSGQHGITLDTLDAAMHLSDKKLLVVFVIGLFTLGVFLTRGETTLRLVRYALERTRVAYRWYGKTFHLHDHLQTFLRKGVIHSKAY